MNTIDITKIGYRWQGTYSPSTTYVTGDVVLNGDSAYVYRNGAFTYFAPGQQIATTAGQLVTGGGGVSGVDGSVLQVSGPSSVIFNPLGDHNGSIPLSLIDTDNNMGEQKTNNWAGCIMNDNTVRAWGLGTSGQLGTGDLLTHYRPVQPRFPSGTKIVKYYGVFNDTFYIDSNGQLWHSGQNYGGCGGTNNAGTTNTRPTLVNGNGDLALTTKVASVFFGTDHYGSDYISVGCIDTNGVVYVWGINGNGQLGDGTTTNRAAPYKLTWTITNPCKYGCFSGAYAYCAGFLITTTGQLYVSGNYSTSGYGNGSDNTSWQYYMPWGAANTVKLVRVSVSDGPAVGAQYYIRTAVLLDNGDLYMWGNDYSGAGSWGTGYTGDIIPGTSSLHPYKCLTSVKDIYTFSGYATNSIALMNDGTVKWSGNNTSYIGREISSTADTTTWLTIGGSNLTNVTKLRVIGGEGTRSAIALKSDNTCIGWGCNGSGVLGTANFNASNGPDRTDVTVTITKPILDFALLGNQGAGSTSAALFLSTKGELYATGYGGNGMNFDFLTNNSCTPQKIIF